jgi:heterodisulfide reductase subunit B
MRYAYYPGCASESTARDLHASSIAVAEAVGMDFIEPDGWVCCGATAAHQTDRILATSLPAANLLLAQQMGLDMVVHCAACYSRLKAANHEITTHPEIRQKVAQVIGLDYDGSVKVRHFIEVLLEDIGTDRLHGLLQRSLNGLKVACYYGCLLVRPQEVTCFDNPENPTSMDNLIACMGGENLDWPHKVECCGGGLSPTRTDVVVHLSDSIISMARSAGADCIAVACPMCQINLDLRQSDIKKEKGRQHDTPIVYITQLLGLALGVEPKELGLDKLMVSPARVLEAIG